MIDLSKAIKLKVIQFHVEGLEIEWIIATLKTITQKHEDFKEISFNVTDVMYKVKDNPITKWLELESLIVKFWEERSIQTKVIYGGPRCKGRVEKGQSLILCPLLLPNVMKEGIVDMIEVPD